MDADPSAPAQRPQLAPIGEDDRPIRAIAFSGGGIDTAMQLGVIHALLVSRGKAPDVVIGSSTGAVNAVALAEVFQADSDIERRVARFRQLYEGYRNAPGKLSQAFRPDFFQVDTQRPLDPLQLPIHHDAERQERRGAVLARAGLINLYNTLLAVRVTFGTLTRVIRRALGLVAARDDPSKLRRTLVTVGEGFRSWMLVGQNLHRLHPLVWPAFKALLRRRFGDDEGATAAQLIFRSWLRRLLVRGFGTALSFAALVILWLGGALGVVLALGVLGLPVALAVRALFSPGFWILAAVALGSGAAIAVAVFVAFSPRGRWRMLATTLWTLTLFALLVVGWTLTLGSPVILVRGAIAWADGELMRKPWLSDLDWWIPAGIFALTAFTVLATLAWQRRAGLLRWVLAQFDLDEAVFSDYPLRQILSSLFDPEYYGPLKMDEVVDNALRDDPSPRAGPLSEKRLDDYAAKRQPGSPKAAVPPIHVLLAVMDLAEGRFKVLPGWWRVVDGLTAALAAVPLFPPVACDDAEQRRLALLIDASVVSNEPTRPLFSFLRHSGLVNKQSAVLHLYSVASLPFGRPSLGEEPDRDGQTREYTALLDGALRAWELKRFRDAALERRLTELNTWTMPRDNPRVFHAAFLDPKTPGGEPETKEFLRSWVYAIEPERPLRVTERMLRQEDEGARRRIVAETVADGCRAALQVMLQPTIAQVPKPEGVEYDTLERMKYFATNKVVSTVRCGAAIHAHLGKAEPLPGSKATPDKGSMERDGPGLAEVCKYCALFRDPDRGAPPTKDLWRALRVLDQLELAERPWPKAGWPREGERELPWTEPARLADREVTARHLEIRDQQWHGKWPLDRAAGSGHERPTVSLLFSGGVFRGVFQVGALNALSEVSLVPDLVAGASVGSITAAMVARAFVKPADSDPEAALAARRKQVMRVAATYLGIDRLVLTDRFADFIRSVTVRAAQAQFSLRDADRVLRRFDAAGPGQFSRELRRVVAGIERLTYISPFELRELLEAFRLQQFGRALRLLRKYFQEWLDRVGVGSEVLGAEPLALLIREFVLEGLTAGTPEAAGLDAFMKHGMFFLATATNLTRGKLHILGDDQLEKRPAATTLLDSLLASSAFPGVFRPRWAWEIFPIEKNADQYIDGGVMDNLPLDAVAQFLHLAATAGVVKGRPRVPHLLFCASLEEEIKPVEATALDELRYNWPKLLRHARRLSYNEKLHIYGRTQTNLRGLAKARGAFGKEWAPLDLEVVTVLPRWLCSTFGFHPMLGFRRSKQAQSIAHGCASTLHRLAEVWRGYDGEARMAAWGVDTARLPEREPDASGRVPLVAARRNGGHCWYQPKALCPFSAEGQTACNAGLPDATHDALTEIYEACRRPDTHLP